MKKVSSKIVILCCRFNSSTCVEAPVHTLAGRETGRLTDRQVQRVRETSKERETCRQAGRERECNRWTGSEAGKKETGRQGEEGV